MNYYHLSKKLNENYALPTLIDFSYQVNASILVFESDYKEPYFIVYNNHDALKATQCIRVLCYSAAYLHVDDTGVDNWELPLEIIYYIDHIMKQKQYPNMTKWEYCIDSYMSYKDINCDTKPIHPMPNYMQLTKGE